MYAKSEIIHLTPFTERIDRISAQSKRAKAINFVRERQPPPSKAKEAKSILGVVDDWNMTADIDKKKLIFPSIVHTILRPDIVM